MNCLESRGESLVYFRHRDDATNHQCLVAALSQWREGQRTCRASMAVERILETFKAGKSDVSCLCLCCYNLQAQTVNEALVSTLLPHIFFTSKIPCLPGRLTLESLICSQESIQLSKVNSRVKESLYEKETEMTTRHTWTTLTFLSISKIQDEDGHDSLGFYNLKFTKL
jgi:hypothetical protein